MNLVAHKLTPACKGASLINHRFSCFFIVNYFIRSFGVHSANYAFIYLFCITFFNDRLFFSIVLILVIVILFIYFNYSVIFCIFFFHVLECFGVSYGRLCRHNFEHNSETIESSIMSE